MKNKLLLTSALASSLIAGGSAIAQTTITGDLVVNYRTQSFNGANSISSTRTIGRESQLNIQNKGKLTNGMDYAAGFSLEFDGNDTASTTAGGGADLSGALSGENVYIDLISGNTTFTFGADHIQNPDTHAHINPAGVGYITSYTAGTGGIYPTAANSVYGSFGLGVVQKVPNVGSLSFNWVPNPKFGTSNIAGSVGPDIGNAATVSHYDGVEGVTYEVGFVGDFGVKGLSVMAFKVQEQDQQDAGTKKVSGYRYGGSYNFGDITVGLDKTQTTGSTNVVVNGRAASLTFAATKDLSLGATYGKADKTAGTADEKIKLISLGYNLGPVVLNATVRDVDNIGGVTTNGDSRDAIVKLSTKF